MRHNKVASVIFSLLLVLSFGALGSPAANPIAVEVWTVGDDVLSLRLRDALESALSKSSEFTLSSGKKPGTLILTIPTNVHWKKIGARTKVSYIAEFTSVENTSLGSAKGSCWDDNFVKCASNILKQAKVAARKMP